MADFAEDGVDQAGAFLAEFGAGEGDQRRLELIGADVVEVIPTGIGSTDVTALVAERIVRELLTGLALRRTRA